MSTRNYPDGWTLTVRELINRPQGATGEEIAWARAYERDRLPKETRFPRHGEVFEAVHAALVTYLIHYSAPATGGGETQLAPGQRIRIVNEGGDTEPIAVGAEPLDASGFWETAIPADERNHPQVCGFSLSIRTSELNRRFRLIDGSGTAPRDT